MEPEAQHGEEEELAEGIIVRTAFVRSDPLLQFLVVGDHTADTAVDLHLLCQFLLKLLRVLNFRLCRITMSQHHDT